MKFKKLKVTLTISIVLFTILISWLFLEARWIKIKNVEIRSTDIPQAFDGFKIVFVSDIHHGPYFSLQRVNDLVEKINNLNPDLIVLGGDYVHRDAKYIKPLFCELENLKAEYGVYAVSGNHDHWEDIQLTQEMMILAGMKNCDNRSYWVRKNNDSIKIGGVGDYYEDCQIIDSTICDVVNDNFCILISHSPDYIPKIETDLIDLTFSGHTHGGQVTLFGLWAPIVPSEYSQKYRYGLVETGKIQSYITSGIGTITPPIRFFCRPEIVVVTLIKE